MNQKETHRGIGRRKEDRLVRDENSQYKKLLSVGQIITSEIGLKELFRIIMEETNRIMQSERSTVFLHDDDSGRLYSFIATGMETELIRIYSDSGIAGWVFKNQEPLCSNDVQQDPRFYRSVDKKTGFITKQIVCVPLINKRGKCIGVIQALNKTAGDFSQSDVSMLESIANYVAISMENAKLHQKVIQTSEKLETALLEIERLELIKSKLTNFVPTSIKSMLEVDPCHLDLEKKPMKAAILFIDVQDFSRISESYEQNIVNNMIETYFSAYLRVIYRRGGEISESSGDGIMAFFKDKGEAENSREAVFTGYEIVQETERLNRQKLFPCGAVNLHLGINTGEVWVGCTQMKSIVGERYVYTASGMATIVAARIGALSSDSKIFIGPDTYKAVSTCCKAEFIGEKQVKNVKAPIPVHWVKQVTLDTPIEFGQ